MKTLSLSQRTELLAPSPTLAMTARARELKSQGIDVISFAAGEPDFNTPAPICHAAIQALNDGKTKYAPSRGLPELRQAIAEKTQRDNNFTCTPDQIVVSCGAKHSLYNAFQCLINPGDEVILIAPYWATYSDQIKLAGGIPVVVQTSVNNNFLPDPEHIKTAITEKTKAIVINSPSNPTGTAYSPQLTKQIADIALNQNLWIIADEIYELLVYGHTHTSIASFGPDYFDRTVTILGCSKSYSMTGWRIGFSIANKTLTSAMANLQDQVTSNATTFAQVGATEALKLPLSAVEEMIQTFQSRRDLGFALLNQIPNTTTNNPLGAFYLFTNVQAYCTGKFKTDVELAEYLLNEAYVATVPGTVFDAPGHLRISYACSEQDITNGINRIKTALENLPV